MKFTRDHVLTDIIYIEPKLWGDDRGYFFESYKEDLFKRNGIHCDFVQDNQSYSQKHVLRGLHFQRAPKAQAKLVRCLDGEIFDVAVDIRKNSPTFGKWTGVVLNSSKHNMLFIPGEFAHGFLVLSDTATVMYKCSESYSPEHEGSVIWNDKSINIQWPLEGETPILSPKDAVAGDLLQLI